ncbi:MAG: HAD family hydrolase [Thermoplasmata archaeon]
MTPPEAAAPVWRLVTVDIDGTLTTVHGWRVIADAFGRTAEFSATQRRFFAHEEGEDEHLRSMLAIAAGHRLAEVEAVLEATPRIQGIAEGVRSLQGRGSKVALLTHNPRFVCEWYARKFGFDDFEGCGGSEVVDGVVQPPADVRADKPAGLRALLERHSLRTTDVVHIGDGRADAALFSVVDRGVALNSSDPGVERAADLALHSNDFRAVAAAIEDLRPRT